MELVYFSQLKMYVTEEWRSFVQLNPDSYREKIEKGKWRMENGELKM